MYTDRSHILSLIALFIAFFALDESEAQTIVMPRNGHDTVYLTSGNSYTILDPGGTGNYYTFDNSTLVLISSDGRPFSISGDYHIMGGHCLTIYQGTSKNYPIENFYTDTAGSVEVYCPGGAATLNFTTTLGRRAGFALTVCFPPIYDVHAYQTNSTYTHLSWTDTRWSWYGWHVNYHLSGDPSQSTTHHSVYSDSDSLPTLAPGFEYTYYVGNNYYEMDVPNICTMPPHHFRTPKVQDCNTCDHYRQCIDYTDFNNASQVMCFKGNTGRPDSTLCVVNEGSDSPLSQHTINNDTTARDSRTGGLLRTIPLGDTSSVRLGNWTSGGGGESILYEIHVDTNDYDLLMLRYAVVFKYSSGVGGGLPRFTIKLFDQNCLPVNPLCYCRDYVCDSSDAQWHVTASGGASAPYVWHDWIAMSIDISAYHGKTLYLQLSTRDGSASGAAYAYFTLHCGRKQIDHLQQCANNIANTFYAPEGFTYRWYKAGQPGTTLSTTRSLHVETAGLYLCQVNNLECPEGNCGYIINALASPRYALADFDDSATAANCRFSVRLTNRSVVTDADSVPLWTREDCETALWDFGDGRTSTNYNTEVVYTNPGTYNITLITSIAGGQCADTMTKSITLNWQYPRATISGPSRVCPGTDVTLTVNHTTSQTWHVWGYQHTYPELPLDELDQNVSVTCDVTDSNQCTYTLSKTVTILPAYNQGYSLTRCDAQLPVSWRDTTFLEGTVTGDYVFHRQTSQLCDSTVTLHLNILPTYNTYRTENVCDYAPRWRYHGTVHGTSFDTTFTTLGENIYQHHLPSGCDSNVHITLNQLTAPRTIIYATRCQGYAFDSADFLVTALQTQDTDFLIRTRRMTQTPCDSFATLRLSIFPPSDTTISLVITQNELPFIFAGDTFTHSVANHDIVLTNHYGCDSTIHFTLLINYNTSTTLQQEICDDALPYTWDGLVFDSAGRQQIVFPRGNGADSIVYHLLTVHPTHDIHDTTSLCRDQMPYAWRDTLISTAPDGLSTHSRHLTTAEGCDSLMSLHLTVNPLFSTSVHDTICSNSLPYMWNDSTVTSAPTGIATIEAPLSSQAGCDSTVTMTLTVHEPTASSVWDTIVENQLPWSFNGTTFNISDIGVPTDNSQSTTVVSQVTINNTAGCDSVITLHLTVFLNVHDTVDSTICSNALPLAWNSVVFDTTDFLPTATGTQTSAKNDTLTSSRGADSVLVMRLHVNPVYDLHFAETICDNEVPYLWNGTTITSAVSGISSFDFHFLSSEGCDSSVTLLLTVNEVTHSTVHDTITENQLPWLFNSTLFGMTDFGIIDAQPATLSTQITITNHQGCDSTISYHLTMYLNVHDTVDSTVCHNMLPLTWNGVLFDTSDYDATSLSAQLAAKNAILTSWTGADSLLTMLLYVNPVYELYYNDTICSNGQTTFNDSIYSEAGNYRHLLHTTVGCDSAETLHLTTLDITYGDTVATACDSLSWWGISYTTSTSAPTHTTTNSAGCDSVVTLHLTINHSNTGDTLAVACDSFYWHGTTYHASATPTHQTINNVGCDSVATLHLTVNHSNGSSVHDTITENDLPWTFNGAVFTTGDYDTAGFDADPGLRQLSTRDSTILISNHLGCDSVIGYHLTVRWNKVTHLDSSVCQNYLPLNWQGALFDSSGFQFTAANPQPLTQTDTVIYGAAHGEDSLVVLHLTVNPNTSSVLHDTIIENDLPWTWNGVTMTWDDTVATGLRQSTLTSHATLVNADGCDSLTQMHLLVWLNRTATADSSVCEGEFPFVWNSVTFDADPDTLLTTLTSLIHTTHGADSLLTMNVTRLLNSSSYITDTIFERQLPYLFNGYLFADTMFTDTLPYPDADGIYTLSWLDSTVTISNAAGCDSLISYHLVVHWNIHRAVDSTICADMLPLTWNAIVFDTDDYELSTLTPQSATKSVSLPAWNGADSVVAMTLLANPVYITNLHDTLCEAQSYVWYDDTLSVTGVYSQHFFTVDGCDSSEYLHFANYPNYDFTYYDTICDYSGVMRIGVEYVGYAHLNTIHLCDSNETYHLWGMPVSYSTIDTVIGDNNLPFQFGGETFADTGVSARQVILVNQWGCDSIVNFTLTVVPTWRLTLDSTVCADMLPLTWDGTIFDPSDYQLPILSPQLATKTDTLSARWGVDSIVTRVLHVNPVFDLEYEDTTCNGAPYHFGDSLYAESGTYTHYYITQHNCDSVETLTLQVNAMSYATQSDTIVQNSLPWTFGGVTFTSLAGVSDTIITILNTVACDSVITYSLTILPNTYRVKDTTICDSQLPMTWDGLVFNASSSNQLTDSTTTTLADGTDSVTRYHVTIHPTYDLTDTLRACDSLTWINGTTYRHSTRENGLVLQSMHGCDSVKNLILTIDSSCTTTDSILSCDMLTWIDGFTYEESIAGVSHMLNTIHGCDSLVYLQFTRAHHKATDLYDTICQGVHYHFGSGEYSVTGDYNDSLRTVMGCDSVVTLHLEVLQPWPINISEDHDCDLRTYAITVHTEAPYYVWDAFPEDRSLAGQEHNRTVTVRPQTHELYRIFADYKDVPTCPSTDSIYLSPLLKPHAQIAYTPEFLTLDQPQLNLHSRSTNEKTLHWWINGDDYGDFNHLSYTADATQMPAEVDSVSVMLVAYNNPCTDTDLVLIPFRKAAIWAPNTFTPDESNNNLFFVRYIGITDYSIDLYTRGGALVWHSEDMNDSWDGTANGKACPQGTYVWIIHYRDITNPRNQLSKKGTVTLLR